MSSAAECSACVTSLNPVRKALSSLLFRADDTPKQRPPTSLEEKMWRRQSCLLRNPASLALPPPCSPWPPEIKACPWTPWPISSCDHQQCLELCQQTLLAGESEYTSPFSPLLKTGILSPGLGVPHWDHWVVVFFLFWTFYFEIIIDSKEVTKIEKSGVPCNEFLPMVTSYITRCSTTYVWF